MRSNSSHVRAYPSGGKVVSRSKSVAGVYAHPDTAFVLHLVDYFGEMLELVAEIRPLSGCGFNHCHYAGCLVESHVERFGNGVYTFFLRNHVKM